MPASHHLICRGTIYYWRRRVTTGKARTTLFQLSLMSRDKGIARRLGAGLTFVSDLLAPELSCGRLAASAFKTRTLADDIAQAFQERPPTGANDPLMQPAAIASPGGSDAAAASGPTQLSRPDDCSAARLRGLASPVAPFEPDVPTISALAHRFCSRKSQLGEWTDKTAQTAALSVKVVGHDCQSALQSYPSTASKSFHFFSSFSAVSCVA